MLFGNLIFSASVTAAFTGPYVKTALNKAFWHKVCEQLRQPFINTTD
jgi:hypothetical protein